MSRDPKSNYYDAGGIEVIDIIQAKMSDEQYSGYLLGSALEYHLRLMFKYQDLEGRIRDAEKGANFSKWHFEFLKKTQPLLTQKEPVPIIVKKKKRKKRRIRR